jgi:hypothetical protein
MDASEPPTSDGLTLDWADFEEVAAQAFSIWVGQPELRWAREAWEILGRAGLSRYHGERERATVAIRFLALAGFYHDFCEIAWEEYSEPEYDEWATSLGVSPFRVGQLIADAADFDEDDTDDDGDDVSAAVRYLAEQERPRVVRALRNAYGGTSGLFLALWRSCRPEAVQKTRAEPAENRSGDPQQLELEEFDDEEGEDEDEFDEETDDEILNDATAEKMAAFEWLEEGGPTVSH